MIYVKKKKRGTNSCLESLQFFFSSSLTWCSFLALSLLTSHSAGSVCCGGNVGVGVGGGGAACRLVDYSNRLLFHLRRDYNGNLSEVRGWWGREGGGEAEGDG